jgi:hypothetical protein
MEATTAPLKITRQEAIVKISYLVVALNGARKNSVEDHSYQSRDGYGAQASG